MTQQEKDSIREALRVYAAKYSSQKKAAASLNGVSAGTLSAVVNGKYESISDDMFRNIISQITCSCGHRLAARGNELLSGDMVCPERCAGI